MIDKVMVFPQAYAAVVPKSSMVVNMLRVFVVDIGGYTTDVLLLKNGKPDLQFCRSLETGIITMNNEIIRKVGALHDMRIEDEHISAVLSGQDTILPDDVKQTICGATKLHAQDILNQLRELQVDLRSNPAVFILFGAGVRGFCGVPQCQCAWVRNAWQSAAVPSSCIKDGVIGGEKRRKI